MKKLLKLLLMSIVLLLCRVEFIYAQDENWEPQTFVSGYVNTIAEITNQNDHVEANREVGLGLANVGFLVSHKPKPNIELKGTFVWDQQIADLQTFVVEAYGIYTFSNKFKVGVGKFLTPLSPVNTYFYAPLNPSVSLPMVVTHYLLTPQSISGLQFSGEFGNDLKINYNVTYGNYTTFGHIRTGIIGLIGREDAVQILGANTPNGTQFYDLGGSARLAFDYKIVSLGLNYFDGTRATLPFSDLTALEQGGDFTALRSRKFALGSDFHINFNDRLKINAEYWIGENKTNNDERNFNPNTGTTENVSSDYDGWYAELLYTIGKFTPYIRYEEVDDISSILYAGNPRTVDPTPGGAGIQNPTNPTDPTDRIPWGTQAGEFRIPTSAIGAGVGYRPIYELLLKADFRYISNDANEDAESFTMSLRDEDFYHLIFSAVFSF